MNVSDLGYNVVLEKFFRFYRVLFIIGIISIKNF